MQQTDCRRTLLASRTEGEQESRIYTCPKGGCIVAWGPREQDEDMLELICKECER